ncbi:hypothetical protein U062_02233 [Gammaproteobacteria bacterium MOLA455]|nr:hypothetical protein U062_02233 [Gammaproteobacteria bacterium MOLA455]
MHSPDLGYVVIKKDGLARPFFIPLPGPEKSAPS